MRDSGGVDVEGGGVTGSQCPIDFCDSPFVVYLSRSYDDNGHERGARINGIDQCPKCGIWWPCIEEPDCWEQRWDGKWMAIGWWGAAVCEECELLMVEQPDGRGEVYGLR